MTGASKHNEKVFAPTCETPGVMPVQPLRGRLVGVDAVTSEAMQHPDIGIARPRYMIGAQHPHYFLNGLYQSQPHCIPVLLRERLEFTQPWQDLRAYGDANDIVLYLGGARP